MLRFSPPRPERLLQSKQILATTGGSEANALVTIARFGAPTSFVTVLAENNRLADTCVADLRHAGIDTTHIVRGPGRLGLYFLEPGSGPRPTSVFYDRENSALALAQPGAIDWDAAFHNASWFHISGITPAISPSAAGLALESLRNARDAGLTISFDLNYRKKLWRWGKTALDVLPDLVRLSDILIANDADVRMGLGFDVPPSPRPGFIDPSNYQALTGQILHHYPNLKAVTLSLREPLSPGLTGWSSCLHHPGRFLISRHYILSQIIDGVGVGDCFAGAFIYGWQHLPSPAQALEFAVAASCLKHAVPGDFADFTIAEVEDLLAGGPSSIRR